MNQPVIHTQALIIGAGPAGLFQAFQLGLLGIKVQVVDALPQAGGQCTQLYADKYIYDIPGLPCVTAKQLVDNLLTQVRPFAPTLHLGHVLSELACDEQQQWQLRTEQGLRFQAPCVVLAAGVGCFQPHRLAVEGLRPWEGRQVFYQTQALPALTGKKILVVGGDAAAIAQALQGLAQGAAQVTLLHRRAQLAADAELLAHFETACATGKMQFIAGQIQSTQASQERLQTLTVLTTQQQTVELPVDVVVAMTGLAPKLDMFKRWGFDLQRKQVTVNAQTMETQLPRVYAVGDMAYYPGKKKLILCGFHEATLAAYSIAACLYPLQPPVLEYTTTSSRLQQRLGLAAN